jgi:hypothetical protein
MAHAGETLHGPFLQSSQLSLVRVIMMVHIVMLVMVHVAIVRAGAALIFELGTAFARLLAIVTVALNRVAEPVLSLAYILLTSGAVFVSVIGTQWRRCPD